MFDICIIGGGASGMAAAITAAQKNKGLSICLLEKKEEPGKKLLATGNGRCNLTNAHCKNVKQSLEFFAGLGILTRQEEAGRIYPYTGQAKDIVLGLRQQMMSLGIEVITNYSVSSVIKKDNAFQISGSPKSLGATKIIGTAKEIEAGQLLLATGGKAGPQYGTTGDGYKFAKTLGHTVTKLAPSLTAMLTTRDMTKLKGIRFDAHLKLWQKDQQIAEETGQVQITADGISGICVFNLSRFVKLYENTTFQDYVITVDFLPHMTTEQVFDFLKERKNNKCLPEGELLLSVLAKPLAQEILMEAQIRNLMPEFFSEKMPQDTAVSVGVIGSEGVLFSENDLRSVAGLLKGWKLQISGVKGWKQAQCTSGGVPLTEVNPETMESNRTKGLYFVGELLDFDGPCGGYNLQHAWETGIKAGKAMAHV